MRFRIPEGLRVGLAWLVFPLVPALVGQTYHQVLNFGLGGGPDPRDWGWSAWVILVGPLLGYAYLAGATIGVPEDEAARGLRKLVGRRWVWVAIGPWAGFLSAVAIAYGVSWIATAVRWMFPRIEWSAPSWLSDDGEQSWASWLFVRGLVLGAVAWVGYGWMLVAWALHRRARRLGCSLRAFYRGVSVAFLFLGSLFGAFWAITEAWRDYFFDRRIVPVLLLCGSLLLLTGCGSNLTYGEVRRRELFQSMLLAWLVGLGLIWRWWGRTRAKPPVS